MPAPTDPQLIQAILQATAHLSRSEREWKTGISHATFYRWRRGLWKELQIGTRERAIAYLERTGRMPEGVSARSLEESAAGEAAGALIGEGDSADGTPPLNGRSLTKQEQFLILAQTAVLAGKRRMAPEWALRHMGEALKVSEKIPPSMEADEAAMCFCSWMLGSERPEWV